MENTKQYEPTKRIRSKKQLMEHIYYAFANDNAIKSITPLGTRDLIVTGSKEEYRIRLSKVKRSGRV